MIYSIPNTQPPEIFSCEATEDALFLQLGDRVDCIARKNLSTKVLIQEYGATLAATRLAQSYGERTYAQIHWQVAPLLACTIGVGALAAYWSASLVYWSARLVLGLGCTLFMGSGQCLIHACAYESVYRSEDPTLFKNVDQGLINLRRIEALDLKELDKVSLTYRIAQIQNLVNATLVARRTDPTVSEKIIISLISSLFGHDYPIYQILRDLLWIGLR